MKGQRAPKSTQQTKLDKYALFKGATVEAGSSDQQEENRPDTNDLTLKDIMAAIKDVKGVLETKIDTTAI